MSNEAWLELSQLLVDSSPTIKNRLLNTLRNIGTDEEQEWLERYERFEKYEEQHRASVLNPFVHIPNNQYSYRNSQVHKNVRVYVGSQKPYWKLTIKFVDNETDFEYMLDELQVCVCLLLFIILLF